MEKFDHRVVKRNLHQQIAVVKNGSRKLEQIRKLAKMEKDVAPADLIQRLSMLPIGVALTILDDIFSALESRLTMWENAVAREEAKGNDTEFWFITHF